MTESSPCALHQQPATRACDRCGSFMCARCELFGEPAAPCPACRDRNGSSKTPTLSVSEVTTMADHSLRTGMATWALVLVASYAAGDTAGLGFAFGVGSVQLGFGLFSIVQGSRAIVRAIGKPRLPFGAWGKAVPGVAAGLLSTAVMVSAIASRLRLLP